MSHISRVELMCQIESVLLGDPFHFLTNFPPSRLARKLPDCNILASLCRKVFGLFGSHNFLLFSARLKAKQAVFYPNQSKVLKCSCILLYSSSIETILRRSKAEI